MTRRHIHRELMYLNGKKQVYYKLGAVSSYLHLNLNDFFRLLSKIILRKIAKLGGFSSKSICVITEFSANWFMMLANGLNIHGIISTQAARYTVKSTATRLHVNNLWFYFKTKPRHPDLPKEPCAPHLHYLKAKKDSIMKKHPGIGKVFQNIINLCIRLHLCIFFY